MQEKNKYFAYGAIFFVSMALLMFEVILTRIFSVMLWYHFAYVVISIAMLGLGASGSLLAVGRLNRPDRSPERLMAWVAAAFPLVMRCR